MTMQQLSDVVKAVEDLRRVVAVLDDESRPDLAQHLSRYTEALMGVALGLPYNPGGDS